MMALYSSPSFEYLAITSVPTGRRGLGGASIVRLLGTGGRTFFVGTEEGEDGVSGIGLEGGIAPLKDGFEVRFGGALPLGDGE